MQRAKNQDQNSQQQDPTRKAERQWRNSVGLRVITSFIAIPIVLLFVWLGGWWAFAATVVIGGLGIYELHNMMLHSGYRPLLWVSLGLSVLFLVSAMFPQQRLLVIEITLAASLLCSFPLLFRREKLEGALVDWALTLAFAVYLGWSLSLMLLLRGSGGSWPLPPGVWWLLALLLGVWGFDSAAFFSGHFFGRHKLAPLISPAKTWEGVIGGLLCSIAAALLFTTLPLGVPWYLAVILGLLIGVAATLGDLAESLMKRQTHVKDSGQIMPGHGGILDRIDSLLFAVIVVYLFALAINALPK